MKQIRNKFTGYYVLLICFSVLLFEFLIIAYSGHFFYNQLENQLRSQAQPLEQVLEKESREVGLFNALGQNSDLLSKKTNFEVQVYDAKGTLLIYSYGEWAKQNSFDQDVAEALEGKSNTLRTKTSDLRSVMTHSRPIVVDAKVVGVLRLVAPLEMIDLQIKKMATYFILIGLLVIIITSVGSYLLADTVTTPIQNLIKVTRRMSTGDFSVEAISDYDDEIGELAKTINHLSAEIKKRDYLKNRMFSSVSHELRTPLTAIRGWAETLNDPMYTQGKVDLEDGLGVIVEETARLQSMVEELLDFSRMMSIELSYKFEEMDLFELIQSALSTLKLKANDAGVILSFVREEDGLFAKVDGNRMKQLLVNLLDNAIKFTPEGGTVEVLAWNDQNEIFITVRDTGHGISQEELPFIKERFYKGTHVGSHLGLGLAICDEIVKGHNGKWDIKSTLEKGTCIEMTFPRV